VLWIAVIAIAALVLVFWDQPTGKVIIGITIGVLVALVIIEFLGRPPSPQAPETSEVETAAVPETTTEGSETAPAESESAVVASGVRDSV
jgi:uncharacterized membrane protein YraQ (UPF0718 family)